MVEIPFDQWIADNERLVMAGLQQTGPGPLDYDEMTIDAVEERCIKRFGRNAGTTYFRVLIATFPERHRDLFPEIFGNQEDK